ncbi:putative leader peptide [Streptomyces sp. NPDC001843]
MWPGPEPASNRECGARILSAMTAAAALLVGRPHVDLCRQSSAVCCR